MGNLVVFVRSISICLKYEGSHLFHLIPAEWVSLLNRCFTMELNLSTMLSIWE